MILEYSIFGTHGSLHDSHPDDGCQPSCVWGHPGRDPNPSPTGAPALSHQPQEGHREKSPLEAEAKRPVHWTQQPSGAQDRVSPPRAEHMDRRVTEASLAERPHTAGTHHPLAWTTGATGNPGATKPASRLVEELSWRCDNLEPGEEAIGSLKGQGCSRGCSWSQASLDLDLGSWANMEHLCLSDPRNNICSPELGLGVYSLLWEPGVGGHASPSSPAASGSASPQPPANWGLIPLPRVLSPGAP